VDALLNDVIPFVIGYGPIVIFLITAAETACFLGLLLPAGPVILLGGFLASRGHFSLTELLIATCAGAFVGDQIGYGIGRRWGVAVAGRGGVLGRIWRRYETRATALFRRRSVVAVTVARFLAFVRTLMPWFAGMTRMPYGRFVAYDLLGVLGWGTLSVALGYLAGASWRVMAERVGTATAILLLLVATAGLLTVLRQRRVSRRFEQAVLGAEPLHRRRLRRPLALRTRQPPLPAAGEAGDGGASPEPQ
jgi:membrane-associated protein